VCADGGVVRASCDGTDPLVVTLCEGSGGNLVLPCVERLDCGSADAEAPPFSGPLLVLEWDVADDVSRTAGADGETPSGLGGGGGGGGGGKWVMEGEDATKAAFRRRICVCLGVSFPLRLALALICILVPATGNRNKNTNQCQCKAQGKGNSQTNAHPPAKGSFRCVLSLHDQLSPSTTTTAF
jgi:hypothetical protein